MRTTVQDRDPAARRGGRDTRIPVRRAFCSAICSAFQKSPEGKRLLQYQEYSWTGKFGLKLRF
jgi:hypothetical protein